MQSPSRMPIHCLVLMTCWMHRTVPTPDLKTGYWQVSIKEEDKHKIAFRTNSGQLHVLNQVLFGLCNVPAIFSHFMDHVLSRQNWETCLFHLDDIFVFSKSWDKNLQRLEGAFEHLHQATLKLNAKKCILAVPIVCYFGHRVTRDGLLPDSTFLKAIWDFPPPRNAMQSLLGLATYYMCYVPNFASIASPLHSLTRKDVVCHWTPEFQYAFTSLKHYITTSPLMAFPNFSPPFWL